MAAARSTRRLFTLQGGGALLCNTLPISHVCIVFPANTFFFFLRLAQTAAGRAHSSSPCRPLSADDRNNEQEIKRCSEILSDYYC